jgi:hypothetical protein
MPPSSDRDPAAVRAGGIAAVGCILIGWAWLLALVYRLIVISVCGCP